MPGACSAAFASSSFRGRAMEARTAAGSNVSSNATEWPSNVTASPFTVASQEPQQYDSCYVTQTQVCVCGEGGRVRAARVGSTDSDPSRCRASARLP